MQRTAFPMTILAALIASCTGCGDNVTAESPDAMTSSDADQASCALPTDPKSASYTLTWSAVCDDGSTCTEPDAPLVAADTLQLSFIDKTAQFKLTTQPIGMLDPWSFDNGCTIAITDPVSRSHELVIELTKVDAMTFSGSYSYTYKDHAFRTWTLTAALPDRGGK